MLQKTQTKTIIRTALTKIVTSLRERTENDAFFAAVMQGFAKRERARTQVTVQTLRITMTKEGRTDVSVEKCQEVLKFLADLGLGRLEKNVSGKIIMLADIKHTLQSIGQVATGMKDSKLQTFEPANVYEPLEEPAEQVVPPTQPEPLKPDAKISDYPAVLMVKIDGRMVHFPLPRAISAAELGFLLADLYSGDIKSLTGGTHQ